MTKGMKKGELVGGAKSFSGSVQSKEVWCSLKVQWLGNLQWKK
jgi:hypothetical protein